MVLKLKVRTLSPGLLMHDDLGIARPAWRMMAPSLIVAMSSSPGLDAGEEGGLLGDDAEDHLVESGRALLEVVGILHEGHRVVGDPLLEHEGPGAAVDLLEVAVGVDHFLGDDGAVVRGEPVEQRGEGRARGSSSPCSGRRCRWP